AAVVPYAHEFPGARVVRCWIGNGEFVEVISHSESPWRAIIDDDSRLGGFNQIPDQSSAFSPFGIKVLLDSAQNHSVVHSPSLLVSVCEMLSQINQHNPPGYGVFPDCRINRYLWPAASSPDPQNLARVFIVC